VKLLPADEGKVVTTDQGKVPTDEGKVPTDEGKVFLQMKGRYSCK
jgi:hypothetical protein